MSQVDDKLFRRIVEVSYLTTENAWRYRTILRFFYQQHEKLRHYLFPEEVYEFLSAIPHFQDYTFDQLQQDLAQLVEWNNLVPRQDMGKVNSIEEFRKKRYRYQCTPYTVEIERMVQELEKKGDSFGGSLEKTLFDRLQASLTDMTNRQLVDTLPPAELYARWEELYGHFRKLTENATDYLAHLESEKVEELMLTEAFLAYKDSLTDYLRNFIAVLQRVSLRVDRLLQETPAEYIRVITRRLAEYYLSIPRLEQQPPVPEVVQEQFIARWQSLTAWFVGSDGRESDLVYLQKATNETIRRITRFAQRLGERHHNLQSRRKDYLYLAEWFTRCAALDEAQRLFAAVFGIAGTRHLYTGERESENIYSRVWDEEPTEIIITPRLRQYKPKTKPQAVVSRHKEKNAALKAYLRRKKAEQRLLEKITRNERIVLSELTLTDPHVRKLLLNWIGRCMSSPGKTAKTETGRSLRLFVRDHQRVALRWDDGVLELPNYEITLLN